METLDPSPNEFVVRHRRAPSRVRAGADAAGAWTLVDPASGTYLLRTTTRNDPRGAWEAAVRSVHADDVVLPVLRDQDGVAHYPTGEVTVRFEVAPSNADLDAFARAQRLRLKRRNAFESQQAVFEPADTPRDYLPDVVARVAKASGVLRAWANTASHYTRA
ncbi:MAG TPA: hypothetical protein VNB03_04910 [Casimicrobiaceae bacterium]|nr:hypothetical protein [Casimicrobiaceae bacterium]